VGLNVGLSLLLGLFYALYFALRERYGLRFPGRWQKRFISVMVGLFIGTVTVLIVWPYSRFLLALAWGAGEGILFGLIAFHGYGHSFRDEINTVAALSWSWLNAFRWATLSLLIVTFVEVIETLLYGFNGITPNLLVVGVGSFLLGGLTGERLQESVKPNQGIRLSFKNGLIAALLAGLLMGLMMGLMHMDGRMGLITAILVALLTIPLYGGSNVTQHTIVRILLMLNRKTPVNYTHFLDDAVDYAFLYRVGGGYIFIHYLLQQYFGGLVTK